MARPPKPIEEKRRAGFPGHHPQPAPVLVAGRLRTNDPLPEQPADFSPQMVEAWNVAVADLREGGILDRSDLSAVEMFAVSLGRAREIRSYLASLRTKTEPMGHLLYQGQRGILAHPLLGAERASLAEARQMANLLGLSPSARGHLGIGKKQDAGMEKELDRVLPPRLHAI